MMPPTNRRLGSVFTALTLLFLLATLPMAMVLRGCVTDSSGFSARAVTGSLWSATATDASLGALRLGDLKLRTGFAPLWLGRFELAFAPADGAAGPKGKITLSRGGFGLSGVDASLPGGTLLLPSWGSSGTLTLQGFSARFAADKCTAASGTVTTELTLPGAPPGAGRVRFSGTPTCEGSSLLLPLSGATEAGDAQLFVHIDASGAYSYNLALTASDPAAAASLASLGLQSDGNTYRRRGSGTL